MNIETRTGVSVTLTTNQGEITLGVGMSISAVYALMGLWVENDEELDEALESLFYKTPRPNRDEKWVDVFCKETDVGTYNFRRIPVIENGDDD